MFHHFRDDPEVKIQVWERQQAKKAGISIEAWLESERQAREAEAISSWNPPTAGDAPEINEEP